MFEIFQTKRSFETASDVLFRLSSRVHLRDLYEEVQLQIQLENPHGFQTQRGRRVPTDVLGEKPNMKNV